MSVILPRFFLQLGYRDPSLLCVPLHPLFVFPSLSQLLPQGGWKVVEGGDTPPAAVSPLLMDTVHDAGSCFAEEDRASKFQQI